MCKYDMPAQHSILNYYHQHLFSFLLVTRNSRMNEENLLLYREQLQLMRFAIQFVVHLIRSCFIPNRLHLFQIMSGMSIFQASQKHHVPESTIRTWVKVISSHSEAEAFNKTSTYIFSRSF